MSNSIVKPQSIWQRDIEVDVRGLLGTLAKGGVQSLFGKWDSLAETGLELLDNCGLGQGRNQIAGLLILKSLKRSIHSLLKDNRDLILEKNSNLSSYEETDIAGLEKSLLEGLPDDVWVMNADFFQRPQNLPMLKPVQDSLQQWLKHYLTPVDAKNLSVRLPSYFVLALNEEWLEHPDDYKSLLTDETPFSVSVRQQQGWQKYQAYLQKKVDEPMFLESFGLRQVYVPLRAYFERKIEDKQEIERPDKTKVKRVVVDLETELRQWIDQADPTDAIRLISGGPGSGKSSFTKVLASNLSNSGTISVLYIPLHWFQMSDSLEKSITEFVKREKYLAEFSLDLEDENLRLLIIFDGLDELSMQGKIAEKIAKDFENEVKIFVDRLNYSKIHVQVIISGRDVVIQSTQTQFNKSHQLLSLLPYVIAEEDLERNNYVDAHQLLPQDQRNLWWSAYGQVKGTNYPEIPPELSQKNLFDITAQPLLNYLIALTFERGTLQFTEDTNLNEIYGDLLKGVYSRDYERDHRNPNKKLDYKVTEGIQEKDFVRILEEIALTCWHGDGRTTTVAEIKKQCENSKLGKILTRFQENFDQESGACITRLLTAFYFRASGEFRESSKNFDKTFEFTHKSFGEYLTAQRILRELKNIYSELQRNEEDSDQGCDEKEALTRWAKLCGAAPMDQYIFRFVCDEMQLQAQESVEQWQKMLCRLMEVMLRDGLPMEELAPRPNFKEEMRQARNAEESLFAALNACARVTKKISEIHWQDSTTFGTWFRRIQGQRKDEFNVLAMDCLSWLNLNHCDLGISDLLLANLVGANLVGAKLFRANFFRANLFRANLLEANLFRANLFRANLEMANLEMANLVGANLEMANLKGANLVGANLERANLEGADLEWANLEMANLKGANLEGANLERANLEGADLEWVNLEGANLEWVNVKNTILDKSNPET